MGLQTTGSRLQMWSPETDWKEFTNALWAEGGWKLKLTRVHATEYGIYVTKYLLL